MNEAQLIQKFRRKITLKCNQAGLPLFLYKIPDGARGGLRPFDAVLWLSGKAFAIEFKVGKNKLEPHQKHCLDQVKKTGNRVLIIRETDIDKMIALLIASALSATKILKHYTETYVNTNVKRG